MFYCMVQFLESRGLGHAPFRENYLSTRSAFPTRSGTLNLKSLAQVVLKTCSIVCPKIERSRDLGHAPFGLIIRAPTRLLQEEAVYQI